MKGLALAAVLAAAPALAAQGPDPAVPTLKEPLKVEAPKEEAAPAPEVKPEEAKSGKDRGPDIAGLLAEGYDVKGVLGGALLLFKDKRLFACNLAAVSEYKDQPQDEKPLFTKKCHPLHEAGPLPDTAIKR